MQPLMSCARGLELRTGKRATQIRLWLLDHPRNHGIVMRYINPLLRMMKKMSNGCCGIMDVVVGWKGLGCRVFREIVLELSLREGDLRRIYGLSMTTWDST